MFWYQDKCLEQQNIILSVTLTLKLSHASNRTFLSENLTNGWVSLHNNLALDWPLAKAGRRSEAVKKQKLFCISHEHVFWQKKTVSLRVNQSLMFKSLVTASILIRLALLVCLFIKWRKKFKMFRCLMEKNCEVSLLVISYMAIGD